MVISNFSEVAPLIIVIRRGILFLAIGLTVILIAISFANKSSEAENFEHKDIKCVIIDAGHGAPDGGAVSKNGTVESDLNIVIAKKLKEELTERGYKVVMTREDKNGLDEKKKTDMKMRLDIMSETPADIFVSIHMNKFRQSKYRGAEVLYSNNFIQSTLLAQLIMDEIREIDPENQTRDISEAEKSLYLMRNAAIPAVIVECGFISNPEEEKLLLSKDYQTRMASAVCEGIISYYKAVKNSSVSEESS